MVKSVSLERVIYEDPPVKFEAGTPNVEGAVGLSTAVDYLKKIGMDNIRKHEYELGKRALELAESNKLIEYYGPRDSRKRSGLISFNLKSKKYDRIVKDLQSKSIIAGKLIHSHDVAEFLGDKSVFARSGYHCAEPLFKYLGINGSVRFSWYFYNTIQEIEKAFESLGEINV
jgi:Selenocysteine lyase